MPYFADGPRIPRRTTARCSMPVLFNNLQNRKYLRSYVRRTLHKSICPTKPRRILSICSDIRMTRNHISLLKIMYSGHTSHLGFL